MTDRRVSPTEKIKSWYSIQSPRIIGGTELGTTVAGDDIELLGEEIRTKLSKAGEQTPPFDGRAVFEVVNITDDKDAETRLTEFHLLGQVREDYATLHGTGELETVTLKNIETACGATIDFTAAGSSKKVLSDYFMAIKTGFEENTIDEITEALIDRGIPAVPNKLVPPDDGSVIVADIDVTSRATSLAD